MAVAVGVWILCGRPGQVNVGCLFKDCASTGVTRGASTGTGTARADQWYVGGDNPDELEDGGSIPVGDLTLFVLVVLLSDDVLFTPVGSVQV